MCSVHIHKSQLSLLSLFIIYSLLWWGGPKCIWISKICSYINICSSAELGVGSQCFGKWPALCLRSLRYSPDRTLIKPDPSPVLLPGLNASFVSEPGEISFVKLRLLHWRKKHLSQKRLREGDSGRSTFKADDFNVNGKYDLLHL